MSKNLKSRPIGPNELYANWAEYSDTTFSRLYGRLNDPNSPEKKLNAKKYFYSTKNKLHPANPRIFQFLRAIPGEPHLATLSKKVPMIDVHSSISDLIFTSTHHTMTLKEKEECRLALIRNRVINWKSMRMISSKGKKSVITPFFLAPLGKHFYREFFRHSPDSVASRYYPQTNAIRMFHVGHIDYLAAHYHNAGHEVVKGEYPFDLLIDQKHGFLVFNQHENSIGMEMQMSEAIFKAIHNKIRLYIPAHSPQFRRRILSVLAGLLFAIPQITKYSVVSYLEDSICEDVNIDGWDNIVQASKKDGMGQVFDNLLPFPKIKGLKKSDWIDAGIPNLTFSNNGTSAPSGSIGHTVPIRYINGIQDKDIGNGTKLSIGVGHMWDVWKGCYDNATAVITANCSGLDMLDVPKSLEFIASNANDNNGGHNSFISKMQSNTDVTEVAMPYNHAKAVLTPDSFLLHSMPTSKGSLGYNRESYALVDFSEHPDQVDVHDTLMDMFYALGNRRKRAFDKTNKRIQNMVSDNMTLFGNFNTKGKLTKDWGYFRTLMYKSIRNEPATIYTSHVGANIAWNKVRELRIQSISRQKNHLNAMKVRGSVLKERMWHPRITFSPGYVALGSWDFAPIQFQQEFQMIYDCANSAK